MNRRRSTSDSIRLPGFVLPAAVGAVLLLAGGAVIAVASPAGKWQGWLVNALLSPLSIACWVAIIICVAGISLLATAAVRIGRSRPVRETGDSGGSIVEFALVLPIILMLVLIMVQSSLLMGGNLCVHYAAFCAARTASVVVPMDYPPLPVVAPLRPVRLDYSPVERRDEVSPGYGGPKLRSIRMAAVWAVAPVSSPLFEGLDGEGGMIRAGLAEFFSLYNQAPPLWLDSRLDRRIAYAWNYTDVELAPPPSEAEQVEQGIDPHVDIFGNSYYAYPPNCDLTVRVKHTFFLSVPYASRLFATFRGGADLGGGRRGMEITATSTLTNEGRRDWVDIEQFN